MNVLITGGCGFQGSHLAESYVEKGDFVRVLNTPSDAAKENAKKYLDHKNIEIVWGSVNDKHLLDICMRDIEIVYHLAAKINVDESIENPLDFLNINYSGTNKVLDKAKEQDVPVLYASTCEVYGGNLFGTMNVLESVKKYKPSVNFISTSSVYGSGSIHKMNEWHPLQPASPYAASKAAADRLCYSYYKTYGMDIKIVRPFNIYGERQKRYGFGAVIPIFFENALNELELKIFGDGSQTRDYLHVSDIIKAYHLISELDELKGNVINVGSGQEQRVKDIAEKIISITNKPKDLIVNVEARQGEVNSFIADTTLIEKFGFKPDVEFDDGLKRYYDWRIKDV